MSGKNPAARALAALLSLALIQTSAPIEAWAQKDVAAPALEADLSSEEMLDAGEVAPTLQRSDLDDTASPLTLDVSGSLADPPPSFANIPVPTPPPTPPIVAGPAPTKTSGMTRADASRIRAHAKAADDAGKVSISERMEHLLALLELGPPGGAMTQAKTRPDAARTWDAAFTGAAAATDQDDQVLADLTGIPETPASSLRSE
ncbi:MAG TPA: hypothetical protein VMU54_20455, partial [Planctomycetota bacterium]|nr:hypothetical protein [Planctomycetota bacterium]